MSALLISVCCTDTVWNVSKYGVFYGSYFPTFELNTERYFASLRIQSEWEKIRTRKNSIFGHFSHSKNSVKHLKRCFQPLTILLKNSILDVCLGYENASIIWTHLAHESSTEVYIELSHTSMIKTFPNFG